MLKMAAIMVRTDVGDGVSLGSDPLRELFSGKTDAAIHDGRGNARPRPAPARPFSGLTDISLDILTNPELVLTCNDTRYIV